MDGIIVGCDQTQEWMLAWWWSRYLQHNRHPAAFMDFGMSEDARAWCRERGEVIRIEPVDLFPRKEVPPELAIVWENLYTKRFWGKREAWFRKPAACLKTPFDRSIWFDLDCEVRGPIGSLFPSCDHPSGVALVQEEPNPAIAEKIYNAGVVVFRKGTPLIAAWDRKTRESNHLFCGDQDVLCHLICSQKLEVCELPRIYNWGRLCGTNSDAVVLHWHGEAGKRVISHQILKESLG